MGCGKSNPRQVSHTTLIPTSPKLCPPPSSGKPSPHASFLLNPVPDQAQPYLETVPTYPDAASPFKVAVRGEGKKSRTVPRLELGQWASPRQPVSLNSPRDSSYMADFHSPRLQQHSYAPSPIYSPRLVTEEDDPDSPPRPPRPPVLPILIRVEAEDSNLHLDFRMTTETPAFELYNSVRRKLGRDTGGFYLTFNGKALQRGEDSLRVCGIKKDAVIGFEGFKSLRGKCTLPPRRKGFEI